MIPLTIIRREYIADLFVLSDLVAHARCIYRSFCISFFSLQLFNDASNDVYMTFFFVPLT